MIKLIMTLSYIVFLSTFTFAQQSDEIIENYYLPNDLDIEIFKDHGKYFGKIIGLNNFKDGQTKDVNNPEESKQNDLLMGKVINENLEYNTEEKQWLNGSMYGPEKGMVFNLKITEIRQDEIEVVGSKYLFWKILNWIKI